ncbi:MAG: hypothetical protein PHU75_00770 [Candidatus Nanopelagicales bacterium]|nr:hypothetical protein [Candidatus Nanopelagicales bacterium]
MATALAHRTRQRTSTEAITRGAIGGLAGGILGGMVFGMMMQIMSFMPKIAMLVGSDSVVVGWLAHLAISMALGVAFGVIVAQVRAGYVGFAVIGVMYGVAWWVLGALLLMPAKLGMPTFQFDAMAWKSLMGHMIFGAILGLVTAAVLKQGATTRAAQ